MQRPVSMYKTLMKSNMFPLEIQGVVSTVHSISWSSEKENSTSGTMVAKLWTPEDPRDPRSGRSEGIFTATN